MIQLPLTAEEFAAKASLIEQKHGIALSHEGTITKMGVTASYRFANEVLEINILDKPFFVTTEYCEEQLKALLGIPT